LSEDFSTATEASSPSCQDTVLTYGSAMPVKFYTRHQVLIRRRKFKMKEILNKLFTAADNHGDDSGEADHTVGDLQGLLSRAWAVMSVDQRLQLLKSDEVEELLTAGARDAFNVDDLLAEVVAALTGMEATVTAAGYTVKTYRDDFFWQLGDHTSDDFPTREDAVTDAYQHLHVSKGLA
jgi:hypothetical protein